MPICCQLGDVETRNAPIRAQAAPGQPSTGCDVVTTRGLLGATETRQPATRSSPLSSRRKDV
jgi:hypothetical protein